MSIIFRIFTVRIKSLQKAIDMHNVYAKYAKMQQSIISFGMTASNLTTFFLFLL